MIDYARITVRAGDGGDGTGSFHKIKGKRYGKADGGDGGRGGDVYVEATGDLSTLEKYRYVKDYRAQNGGRGLSRKRRGGSGEDLVLKVSVGTVVKTTTDYRLLTTAVDGRQWTVDLIEDNQRILVARGGEGGRGNAHLKDEFGRRPRVGEKGEAGEVVNITLELKLIADVGLIGLPNAGKSTLLAKLTAARPKIAQYPFTTLEPNLGVLSLTANSLQQTAKISEQNAISGKRLILADIPGLIEGASQGKGLGDLFLRHIERTRVLVHLVDSSQLIVDSSQKGQEQSSQATVNREPSTDNQLWRSYQTVRQELKSYSKELASKREIIVLTKIDLVSRETVREAKALFAKFRKKVLAISAAGGEGLLELVARLVELREGETEK